MVGHDGHACETGPGVTSSGSLVSPHKTSSSFSISEKSTVGKSLEISEIGRRPSHVYCETCGSDWTPDGACVLQSRPGRCIEAQGIIPCPNVRGTSPVQEKEACCHLVSEREKASRANQADMQSAHRSQAHRGTVASLFLCKAAYQRAHAEHGGLQRASKRRDDDKVHLR